MRAPAARMNEQARAVGRKSGDFGQLLDLREFVRERDEVAGFFFDRDSDGAKQTMVEVGDVVVIQILTLDGEPVVVAAGEARGVTVAECCAELRAREEGNQRGAGAIIEVEDVREFFAAQAPKKTKPVTMADWHRKRRIDGRMELGEIAVSGVDGGDDMCGRPVAAEQTKNAFEQNDVADVATAEHEDARAGGG